MFWLGFVAGVFVLALVEYGLFKYQTKDVE